MDVVVLCIFSTQPELYMAFAHHQHQYMCGSARHTNIIITTIIHWHHQVYNTHAHAHAYLHAHTRIAQSNGTPFLSKMLKNSTGPIWMDPFNARPIRIRFVIAVIAVLYVNSQSKRQAHTNNRFFF